MAVEKARAARPYQSPRRDAQADATRQRVLRAATRVFLERGYSAATIRAIAAEAAVSVPTLELLFGTKARLLKAAIDVAIAGDHEPIAILDRAWASAALNARTVDDFLSAVAVAVAASQARSAGLVLAVFEGAGRGGELLAIRDQMTVQRTVMATWIVDGLQRIGRLRADCDEHQAIDTVWVLMDPAVFDRLTRLRHWSLDRYRQWFAQSLARLLTD